MIERVRAKGEYMLLLLFFGVGVGGAARRGCLPNPRSCLCRPTRKRGDPLQQLDLLCFQVFMYPLSSAVSHLAQLKTMLLAD